MARQRSRAILGPESAHTVSGGWRELIGDSGADGRVLDKLGACVRKGIDLRYVGGGSGQLSEHERTKMALGTRWRALELYLTDIDADDLVTCGCQVTCDRDTAPAAKVKHPTLLAQDHHQLSDPWRVLVGVRGQSAR